MATTLEVLTIARTWLGTPFCHQGRTKGYGADCFGFIVETFREAGVLQALCLPQTYDNKTYSRYPASYGLLDALDAVLSPGHLRQPTAGQLAVFVAGAREPSHLGLLTERTPLTLIHAWNARVSSRARVIEHRFSAQWRARLARVYWLPLEDTPWHG